MLTLILTLTVNSTLALTLTVCRLQMSYELLYNLNAAYEGMMTGPDTNPVTLANALAVLQTSLLSLTSTNATIDNLNTVIVGLCKCISHWCHAFHL